MDRNNDFNFDKMETVRKSIHGLCTTCNSAEICLSLKRKIQPVWFCEQFDNFVPSRKNNKTFVEKQTENHHAGSYMKKKNIKQYKGLCINCELRETCTNCETEGGVWHCEEYE